MEVSELLSRMLDIRKIEHQVLNAKRHQAEAEVVAKAGHAGSGDHCNQHGWSGNGHQAG